jgi:16S rRNA (guanine966-N2)-methyltransferase
MVPGEETRPIGDRVKQSLFDILGADIEGSSFLDLFGGTGSVGIEALSRGAERVVFVDLSLRAIETIRRNLEDTGLAEGAEVVRGDAFSFLQKPTQGGFDYVYVAPPQYQGLWSRTVMAIDAVPRWVNPDGWVIAQIHPTEYAVLDLAHLTEFDQRRYGNTLLCFYELPGD